MIIFKKDKIVLVIVTEKSFWTTTVLKEKGLRYIARPALKKSRMHEAKVEVCKKSPPCSPA